MGNELMRRNLPINGVPFRDIRGYNVHAGKM